ncbi:MAG: thioredoxin-disulfide reductase [Phenylobacterium zucineum]|nr:MAG: thioredoxin-disulfide reductase [Phenylobacterium zucineum]
METIGRDLEEMQRTPLAEAHVRAMRGVGVEATYDAGAFLVQSGDPVDRFVYVLDGEIEVVSPFTGERVTTSTLGPAQFMGEISFLNGGAWSMPMRAVRETRVLEVPRAAMLRLMAEVPEMSDIILTVLAARRRKQLEARFSPLVLIGEDQDRAVRQVADFASRNRLPYASYPVESQEARDVAQSCAISPGAPAVVFGRGRQVDAPTPEKVARLLGVNYDLQEDAPFDVLIVGGGPAGVAAAVYAGAEGLSALVVEDMAVGGQAGASSRIENYMGFPTGISGADLVWRGEVQAMKFGTRFLMPRRVASLEALDNKRFCAVLDNGQRISAGAVVVATGVQYKRLPIARLAEFEGAGVYYAATENEARYCRETEAVVIGGGNSAGQAAMFLSRSANRVRLIVRGRSLAASMSNYLSSRLEADPRITIAYETEVVDLSGGERLSSVTLRNRRDGRELEAPTCALFVMVGAEPNSGWLSGLVSLDDKGFVLTGEAAGAGSPYATSHPGIFAVGDVRAGSVKRVASAVGEGSVVISQAWSHLNA